MAASPAPSPSAKAEPASAPSLAAGASQEPAPGPASSRPLDTDEEPRRPSLIPGAEPPSPEVLAAHDNFVRSPSAVVESLGIRVATAVARKLGSLPPPAPTSDKQLEA
ncbi:MAG: hypothetical protein QM778_15090 [Myxococcales bacterium]